jgi:hypothetical protein
MPRIVLLNAADNTILSPPFAPGGWVTLPNGDMMSPGMAGWQNDADAPTLKMVDVVDFAVPDGKQISGAPTYAFDPATGKVNETFPVEDVPPPAPPPTITEVLAASGYSLTDLKAALGL